MDPRLLIKTLKDRVGESVMGTPNDQSPLGAAVSGNFSDIPSAFHRRTAYFAAHPENISFGGEMQYTNPLSAPVNSMNFKGGKPSFENMTADIRGGAQSAIEEAIQRGDKQGAQRLLQSLSPTDPYRKSLEGVLGVIQQEVPFTQTAPGMFKPVR